MGTILRCWSLLAMTTALCAVDLQNEVDGAAELNRVFTERRQELAARYRIERARALPDLPDRYHEEARDALEAAERALRRHRLPTARKLAKQAIERWPYSHAAAGLHHTLLRSYAVSGDLREARMHLVDLWERFPEYDRFEQVLRECLVAAEYVQQRGRLFDFDAEDPRDIINYDNRGDLANANYLLFFLANNGDRHEIAPRATLGMARGQLIEAGTSFERLIEARLAYDEFIDSYPRSPLVFEALIEQAVSYLLSYRGDQFDMGSLINAKALVDQADLYTGESEERQDLVTRFRSAIRRWQQERDLQVARWYRARGHHAPSRYYYTEVIGRDPTSKPAAAARREREALPEDRGEGMGSAAGDGAP